MPHRCGSPSGGYMGFMVCPRQMLQSIEACPATVPCLACAGSGAFSQVILFEFQEHVSRYREVSVFFPLHFCSDNSTLSHGCRTFLVSEKRRGWKKSRRHPGGKCGSKLRILLRVTSAHRLESSLRFSTPWPKAVKLLNSEPKTGLHGDSGQQEER